MYMGYKASNKSKFFKHYCIFIIFLVVSFLSFGIMAKAVTPTLSISALGDGDSVQLSVTGDANTNVLLYYTKSGGGQQIIPIGYTNTNGVLITTISSSNYGVTSNSLVRVTLGSINGPQSSDLTWPNVSATISTSNMLTLSQTGLVLAQGQTATITASNLNSSTLYLSSNSKPVIANVNISGSQIIVQANSYGSTIATVCLVNNTSNCGSIYINVQSTSATPLTFSQNTLSMYLGQTVSIGISGGSGSYTVLSNSSQNQGIIQTSVSGSNINLTAQSSTGSSSIAVCSTSLTSCGIINVIIGATSTTSSITFSQSTPTLSVGQNLNVSVYGPSSSIFYVTSNSSPNVVQANLSGSTLSLLGITNGSSNIQVCASTSICGTLSATVNYGSNNTGTKLTLSQDSVSVNVGQTATITISGGAMPYNISYTPNVIFQPTLNVNILLIYGTSAGSSLMNVCSYSGNCATLSVIVNSPNTVINLPTGCTSTDGYSPTTGLSCSSTTSSTNNIIAGCIGTNIYSTITGQLCPVATLTNSSISTNKNTPTNLSSNTTNAYVFTKPLKLGSSGAEVKELQKRLKKLGYYNGLIDGKYGKDTEKAVKAYQKAHGLKQLGNVGPGTRAALNK